MILREFNENKKTSIVKRALKETYNMNIDFDNLSQKQTRTMLNQVRGLLKEARDSGVKNHNNQAYLKLVMMEQALSDQWSYLHKYGPRIVVENEEVQKSQVILAAQDMIDSVQKMLEDVSKMNVEELVAVVDGIKNEFGSQEGDQFNSTVSQTLKTLQDALTTARGELTGALGGITGEASSSMGSELAPPVGGAEGMPAPEMGGEMPAPEAPEMGGEEELPPEQGGAGREMR